MAWDSNTGNGMANGTDAAYDAATLEDEDDALIDRQQVAFYETVKAACFLAIDDYTQVNQMMDDLHGHEGSKKAVVTVLTDLSMPGMSEASRNAATRTLIVMACALFIEVTQDNWDRFQGRYMYLTIEQTNELLNELVTRWIESFYEDLT